MSVMDAHCESLDEIFRNIDEQKQTGDTLDNSLSEANDILSEMKISLHSVSNKAKKDEYLVKMQTYNRLMDKHRKSALTQTEASIAGGRTLTATEQNERSLETLKRAHAQLAETEEVGINVLSNLAKQKDTIRHTQQNLKTVNSDLSYSTKLVNRMGKWWRG